MQAPSSPQPVPASEGVRFPRLYAVLKWGIIGTLVLLALIAAAFWALILGGFAGGGFRAPKPLAGESESLPVTAECAWPYRVNDPDARAVCRMFYNLTPAQREEVLNARRKSPATSP